MNSCLRQLGALAVVIVVTAFRVQGGLSDGLVASYPFTGNANDTTGNGHDGVVSGAVLTNDRLGKVNAAYWFDGANDIITVPDAPVWTFGGQAFSLCFWMRFNTTPSGEKVIVGHDEGGGVMKKWVFETYNNGVDFHVNSPGAGTYRMAYYAWVPVVTQWYHLAVTRSGSYYTLYLNGVAVRSDTNSVTIPDASAPLTIGGAEGLCIAAMMDDVRIYNRSLSAAELLRLYNDIGSDVCITSAPATVSYHTTSGIVSGTNGPGIVGDMWVSNSANGEVQSFLAEAAWTAPAVSLVEGTNQIRVYGTNTAGDTYFDSVVLQRGRAQDLPVLDPFTNVTVREHQVFFGQAHGRSNVVTVQCDAGTGNGVVCFDSNAWGFSCIPALGTAGQTWDIAFIGGNAFGSETQVLAVTVGAHAKGIGPRKPLLYEDVDGDLLSIGYSGIKKHGSVALFDGQNLVITNAIPGGKLAFGVKRNKKTGGDGSFTLRDVRMDNDGKSATMGGNVDKVSLEGRRLETLKFTGKAGVVSNIALGSAKTIGTKGTIVGTVAVSNGFETMSAATTLGATVLVGVPVGADYTNTPAQATFRALTVSLMIDTTVTGRDTIESGSIIKPKITAKWAVSSFFFHTKVNATVDIEEIAGK